MSKPLSLSPRKIFHYPGQSLAPFFPIHQFAKRMTKNSIFPRSKNLNRRSGACIVQKFRKLTNFPTPSISPLEHFLLFHSAPSPKRHFNDPAQSFQYFSSASEKRGAKMPENRDFLSFLWKFGPKIPRVCRRYIEGGIEKAWARLWSPRRQRRR